MDPVGVKIVFGLFLPKKAVIAETIDYGLFLFLLRPIYGQNRSEVNFSTCAIDSRFRSIFKDPGNSGGEGDWKNDLVSRCPSIQYRFSIDLAVQKSFLTDYLNTCI